MIKLKRVVTDKGFILEEINSDKINKELIDDGAIKPVDLPHVENNPESVQDHIDAIKKIVDKEKEEMEKKALETKSEDRAIFAESKLFKDRSEMSSFIVKLKEQKIKHRVLPLHEDKEGYRFELRYEKPLNEELNESYETAFEVCEDGSKVSAVGSFKHTKNYTHELVDFDCASGSGSGDYRWMNRPWQRFTFAEALREAMINAGVDEKCAKDCIENSYSLKSAIKYFAEHCCSKKEDELKEEDRPAPKSIEDCQKWIDYDMKHYGKISDNTNHIIKKAGFQIVKDDHGDYEVAAGKYESLEEGNGDKDLEAKLPEGFNGQMDWLGADEEEAIEGYDKVLLVLDPKEYANAREQIEKIRDEEVAHKEFLETLKSNKEAIYKAPSEASDVKDAIDLDGNATGTDKDKKEESLKEDKEELDPIDVFTKYFSFFGDDEDKVVSLCLKNDDEYEESTCISMQVSDEEFEALRPMFTSKEDKKLNLDDDDFDDLDGEEIVDVEEDEFDWSPSLEESKEEDKKEDMWDFSEEDD